MTTHSWHMVHWFAKLVFALHLIMMPSLCLIKISILLFYRRNFAGRLYRYTIALCILIALWALSFMLVVGFQCGTHIENSFTPSLAARKCDDSRAWELAFGISDVITDLMILITPLPIIWSLQMSTRRKVEICGVFLLGLLWVPTPFDQDDRIDIKFPELGPPLRLPSD